MSPIRTVQSVILFAFSPCVFRVRRERVVPSPHFGRSAVFFRSVGNRGGRSLPSNGMVRGRAIMGIWVGAAAAHKFAPAMWRNIWEIVSLPFNSPIGLLLHVLRTNAAFRSYRTTRRGGGRVSLACPYSPGLRWGFGGESAAAAIDCRAGLSLWRA